MQNTQNINQTQKDLERAEGNGKKIGKKSSLY
jgi:hypothetical protein